MIREGGLDATLQYIAENPKRIAISGFSEGGLVKGDIGYSKMWRFLHRAHSDSSTVVQSQGHNIRRYSDYLISRARAFADTKTDYVRSGPGRLKRLTVEKGLLRETEIVQKQIKALLRCDVCWIIPLSFCLCS